jgi:hypothetical protein
VDHRYAIACESIKGTGVVPLATIKHLVGL